MSNHPTQRASVKQHANKGLCNIFENENEWTLDLLVPGYLKSNFTMDVKEGVLKITGAKESTGRKYVKKEFGMNEIERSFTLPKNATVEKISAKLDAGILSVIIPKNENAKPKTINIH